MNIKLLVKDLLQGKRRAIAESITLVESERHEDQMLSLQIMEELQPYTGNSLRIGISGIPGVGKSTFISAFGKLLVSPHGNHKLGILTIDPSSPLSGGSIMGDKTRMTFLGQHPDVFIRPSPSSGVLGGVHAKTFEAIRILEASGCDIIMIETVGTGQNEFTVANMVDVFISLLMPHTGDSLQSIKKGVLELVDILVVHKADGDLVMEAKKTQFIFKNSLESLQKNHSPSQGWKAPILLASSFEEASLVQVQEAMEEFIFFQKKTNDFFLKRKEQGAQWLESRLDSLLRSNFLANKKTSKLYENLLERIRGGQLDPLKAYKDLDHSLKNSLR